jgi:hypothetical protein
MKMKFNKILISLVIVVSMFAVMTGSAFAASPTFAEGAVQHWEESQALYNLGLFSGTSSTTYSPNLTAPLNRTEGVIFIIKLFGKQHQVHDITLAEVNSILARFHDQADIPTWGRPFIAWAVKTHMVYGTNLTELSPLKPLSGSAYCTMILRDLGWQISPETYSYSSAPLFLERLGKPIQTPGNPVTKGSQIVKFNTPEMLRDGAVGIALNALNAKFNPNTVAINPDVNPTESVEVVPTEVGQSLLEYEIENAAFTAAKARKELIRFKLIDTGIWTLYGLLP